MFVTFKKCTNFDIENNEFGSKAKHHLSEIWNNFVIRIYRYKILRS